uniref:Odorant-binding protein 12 n=1 Tax=Monochamus alternatus TaxID=192382 RepID=A0A1I9HZL3_MONAT|nr:odorant-binding protein 12 [Monochamus alternatus]
MNNLLYIVTVLALLTVSMVQAILDESEFTPKLLEQVKALHATCVGQTGADEGLISKIAKGDFVEDPKIKAYMKCGLTELGVMNDNGDIDLDMVSEFVPSKYLSASLTSLNTCIGKTKDIGNLEDRVYALFKCYYDLNPDIFIFF